MNARAGAPMVASSPWPVRLFGDFQYFLGLPAIAMAVDLRTAVSAEPREDDHFSFSAPWIPKTITIGRDHPGEAATGTGILQSVFRVAQSKGLLPEGGYDFNLVSRSPWPESVPESPAAAAALATCLLGLGGRLEALSGNEIAALVAAAFVHREPSARPIPEVYAAVLGGTVLVRPGDPPEAVSIERTLPGVLCVRVPEARRDTGFRAASALRILESLAAFVKAQPDFDLRRIPMEDFIPRMAGMDARFSTTVYAQLVSRDLCRDALQLLENEVGFDDDHIGELLDGSHEMLRDYLGYNEPRMERLIEAAVGGGALGCKVIPDVGGFICFAPSRESDVSSALREAGGEVHFAAISDGVRVEEIRKGN